MSKIEINISGFSTLLTILFIGLKLIGYIHWNWWWVLSPLWVSLIIGVGGLVFGWIVLVMMDRW